MNVSFENVNVINPGTSALSIVDAMGSATFKSSKLGRGVSSQPAISISKDNTSKTGTGMIKIVSDDTCTGFSP
jgi:hypothetical protein